MFEKKLIDCQYSRKLLFSNIIELVFSNALYFIIFHCIRYEKKKELKKR